MRLLAYWAGDVPALAAAEFKAAFEAHGAPLTPLRETSRFLDGHNEAFLDDAPPVLGRLGLTHVAAMHLFDGTPGTWTEGARDCCFPTGIPFAVRYVKVEPDAPWKGPDVEREVGALLSEGRPIDLKRPQLIARAFLLRDRIYVGQQLWESDPKALAVRHVEKRPHATPVSLDPRLARALVNVTRVRPGEILFDPFCGTGGLLLEAAAMGVRAIGSDLDADMVEGCRANLAHYGLEGEVFHADVEASLERLNARDLEVVDAVASDLPYGRSASTGKEPIERLYARAFRAVARVLKPGGYAVLGVRDEPAARAAGEILDPVEVYRVRAHKSLTRHFALLQKGP